MLRMRITTLVLATLFLASKWGFEELASSTHAGPLEGTWQITSVQRDGKADETHVGSRLTFDVDEVRLQTRPWFGSELIDSDLTASELNPITPTTIVAVSEEQARMGMNTAVVY